VKTISKKTREEAIESLSVEADYHAAGAHQGGMLDRSRNAQNAVYVALGAVWYASGYSLDLATDCLEAAALLRDGWSPGDPVVRRGGGS
jgi:hypothetical protein